MIGTPGLPSSESGSFPPLGLPSGIGTGIGLDFFLLSFFTSCFLGIVSGTGYGSGCLISSTGFMISSTGSTICCSGSTICSSSSTSYIFTILSINCYTSSTISSAPDLSTSYSDSSISPGSSLSPIEFIASLYSLLWNS